MLLHITLIYITAPSRKQTAQELLRLSHHLSSLLVLKNYILYFDNRTKVLYNNYLHDAETVIGVVLLYWLN